MANRANQNKVSFHVDTNQIEIKLVSAEVCTRRSGYLPLFSTLLYSNKIICVIELITHMNRSLCLFTKRTSVSVIFGC